MGFLPIIVALLGLILLFSIYTYNQIKPRKANLSKVIDEMAVVSRERKNAILMYDSEHKDSALAEAANVLKRTSTDRFQSFNKEESLITETNAAVEAFGDENLKIKVHSLNEKQKALIQKLHSVSADYNTFISKAPVSTVASVFGFRKF